MIWVAGCRGMLGQEVVRELSLRGIPCVATDRDCDITDPGAVSLHLGRQHVATVINCSAYTAVDAAEDEEDIAMKINTVGPAVLGAAAERVGARVIHVSTDYVFDGEADVPYAEDTPPSPRNAYGRTKAAGEERLRAACSRSYVVRTSWLFGRRGKNFVATMLRLMREREEVQVVDDRRGSPTYARDLATALCTIAASRSSDFGTYHFANSGETTWYGFACLIYQLAREGGHLSKECRVRAISSKDYPTKAARPRYSVLETRRIRNVFGVAIPEWRDAVARYLGESDEEEVNANPA